VQNTFHPIIDIKLERTIPPDIAKIIFIPFFTTKSYGTGIGLALCRQIIVTLGGDIELTDSPYANYNTTFRVRLPYKGK
jgi:signal transduction histidine kinase